MASTIKPLTILIGLNEKLFQPEDTYLDKGTFQYDNQNNITNAPGTPTGEITPRQAIINSSNTFMTAKVALPYSTKIMEYRKSGPYMDRLFNAIRPTF